MSEDKRQRDSRRAFLEALGRQGVPDHEEENGPYEAEHIEKAVIASVKPNGIRNENEETAWTAQEPPADQNPVVLEEEPDLIGKSAIATKRGIGFLFRPVRKGLSVFLAPLWKPFRHGAETITKRDWVLFLGAIAAAVLAVLAPVVVVKLRNTHQENNAVYTYILGQKVLWENGKFEIDDQNRVRFLTPEGQNLDVSGQPFFYEEQNEMFWPFYGLWYSVSEQKCGKVDRFSTIRYEYGNGCTVRNQEGTEAVLEGFLYDNKDTYVFFENVTLTFNNEERNLSPLSYVRVNGNGSMEIIPYGEQSGELVNMETAPTVRFGNGARIDLSGDIMYYPNGVYRLVFGAIDFFDTVGK